VHQDAQAATHTITEVHQAILAHDPVVHGHLGDTWHLPRHANMPDQPADFDPTEGAFQLLSEVHFAPVVETQLSPAASRRVELQILRPSIVLGSVRWIGTNSQLDTRLLLDGSLLSRGSSHVLLDNRGVASFTQTISRAGRTTLQVTNTSAATIKVRLILGALDAVA
jgi:hypothetical protein